MLIRHGRGCGVVRPADRMPRNLEEACLAMAMIATSKITARCFRTSSISVSANCTVVFAAGLRSQPLRATILVLPGHFFQRNLTMWKDGLPVKELTLPLLLVSGYSAVCCSLALHGCIRSN